MKEIMIGVFSGLIFFFGCLFLTGCDRGLVTFPMPEPGCSTTIMTERAQARFGDATEHFARLVRFVRRSGDKD